MTANCYDYIILGGGGSGGWLAILMKNHPFFSERTICIIEKNSKKDEDRTWCFWLSSPPDALLQSIIVGQWTVNLHAKQEIPMTPYTYYRASSKAFYAKVNEAVTSIQDDVLEVENLGQSVVVRCTNGTYVGNYVFSSLINPKPIALNQSFYGWEIRTNKPHFNSKTLELMNFDIPQQETTQFIYVLPKSETEALVEVTRFSQKRIDKKDAEALRDDFLKDLEYNITYEESGAIPMSNVFDCNATHHPKWQRLIPIGTAAGATKPTTGYTFLRMKSHAEAIVSALAAGQPIPTPYRRYRFRLYDNILLRILRDTPKNGKPIFNQLLAQVPHPLVLKFLDEKTTLIEEIKIFSKLPKLLFIKNLLIEFSWKK